MANKKSDSTLTIEKQLAEMNELTSKAQKLVNENAFYAFLKIWARNLAATYIGGSIFALIGFYLATAGQITLTGPIFRTGDLESSIAVIVAPSITIIGLVLGFTPVITFFFINNLKDDQKSFEEQRDNNLKILSKHKSINTLENKNLIKNYFSYLRIIVHNRISGVLKYIQWFLFLSIILLPLLIEAYFIFSPVVFLIADLFIIISIAEGIIPILNVCTYKPAIRIKEHFVGTDVPNQIAIKQELEMED